MTNKALIAMSGGVDSSVAAFLTKDMGLLFAVRQRQCAGCYRQSVQRLRPFRAGCNDYIKFYNYDDFRERDFTLSF